jgi:hypothetical protein
MSDGYVIRGVFTGLTPGEKLYLILHPHHVSIIRDNADKALATARRLFPGAGQHNGHGDAFRHAYWSALLARDIGPANALRFTTAHEDYSANPPSERAMDVHNNKVGISIFETAGPNPDDNTLEVLVQAAFGQGRLMTSPPSSGAAY